MRRIFILLCLTSISLFAQTKTKKVEIYKSISGNYLNAKITIEDNVEKDITIDFFCRDHQYTQITEFLTFYYGTPKGFYELIKKLNNAFNEEPDITLTFDNLNVTVKKISGKKIISLSLKDKSGYRYLNEKDIEKINEKFEIWATENKVEYK